MAVPLADHMGRLGADILAAPQLLICSDFDGTLVPIQDRPERCSLDPALGRVLTELARSDGTQVGIVSGRELADLRNRLGVDGVAYAGNHGLEIITPDRAFRHPTALAARPSLERVVRELEHELVHLAGVWVEDKGLSASVHFRQAEPLRVPQVLETVRRVAAWAVDSGEFVFRTGKAVLEVRPAVDWNKGLAVNWLAAQLFPTGAAPLVVYVGDDDTDEDAFGVLDTGIGVCDGHRPATAAAYHVPDCRGVHWLFDWLAVLAEERKQTGRTRRCSRRPPPVGFSLPQLARAGAAAELGRSA